MRHLKQLIGHEHTLGAGASPLGYPLPQPDRGKRCVGQCGTVGQPRIGLGEHEVVHGEQCGQLTLKGPSREVAARAQ